MINLLRRGAAIVFIHLTVVFWWLLSQGAASVIRAYEGRFEKPGVPMTAPYRDGVILVATLLGAIWAAARAVFPPEDFSPPSKRTTTP